MKQLFVLSILLYSSKYSLLIAQTTYYYKGFGDLNQLSNWGINIDGSGGNPTNFSSSGDVFEVRNTPSITLTTNWSVTGNSSKISIGNGNDSTELIVPNNYSLVGNVVVKNASKLTIQNIISPYIDSLYLGSTVVYSALANQALTNKAYYDLEIRGTGSKTATGDLTVNHHLLVNAILDLNASTEDFVGTCSQVIGNGTIRITSSSTSPIPVGLIWPLTVEFYRNGNQSIPSGEYKSLVVSGNSGIKSAIGGNIAIDSLLSINNNTTLALGTNLLLGNFTNTNGTGVISTTNTEAQPLPSNLQWNFAVTYSASDAGQTIVSGIYQVLNITSGSNTNKASGNIYILDSGTLQVSSANVLDMFTYQLIFGNAITIGGAGTIRTQNTSNNPLPTNQIWTQSVSYNGGGEQTIIPGIYNASLSINGGNRNFISNSSIVVKGTFTATSPATYQMQNITFSFAGNGNQTINILSNFVFYKLLFSGGGTKTLSSTFSILEEINIANTTIVNMGSNALTGNGFNTVGNSTSILRTQNNSTSPIPNNINWNFRIQLDGGSQTIPLGNYWGGITIGGTNTIKTLMGNCEIGDTLTINTTNQVSIGNYTLTIQGFINNFQIGTFIGSSQSNIVITNQGAFSNTLLMSPTNTATQTLNSITLIGGGVFSEVVLGNKLQVSGFIKITNSLLYTIGNLVLTADSISHAEIYEIEGAGNIIGQVTVQHFVSGKKISNCSRWRFLSSSVETSNYILNSWQNQIHITGLGSGGSVCPSLSNNSNGFDCTATNNASFYLFNDYLQSWENLPSTNSTNLTIGTGLRVFVRGNRTQGCELLTSTPPDPQHVVLSATGNLHVGNINIPCAKEAHQFTFIGNPYQSTIDWTNINLAKTNLLPTIYGWKFDASSIGTYGSFTSFPVPDSTNGMSRYISPGTCFFVQTNELGNGAIGFTEKAKSPTNINSPFLKQEFPNKLLQIQLKSISNTQKFDEVVFRIHPTTNWTYNVKEDVKKMTFGNFQLALQIANDTNKYSILRVPNLFEYNNIELPLNIPNDNEYNLHFELSQSMTDSFEFILFDSLLNKRISFFNTLNYPFKNQSNNQRFYIEWKQKSSLVSMDEDNKFINLTLFPNPASHLLFISFNKPLLSPIIIKNMVGESFLLMVNKLNNQLYSIDLSSLSNGEFVAEFKTCENTYSKRFTLVK